MDGLVGGDACPFVPALGDDDGRLAGGLADDHARLRRDGDTFELEITAEDRDLARHPTEVFRGACVPAIKQAIAGYRNLSVNAGPCPFDGTGIFWTVEDFVLAGTVRDEGEGTDDRFRNQRPFTTCPPLKISDFDSERCWITCARTVSTGNRLSGMLESALLIAASFLDGGFVFTARKMLRSSRTVNRGGREHSRKRWAEKLDSAFLADAFERFRVGLLVHESAGTGVALGPVTGDGVLR